MQALSSIYPEISHYTDVDGLRGIISSQTIWATDATYSNDASELKEFAALLRSVLTPIARAYISELCRQNVKNEDLVRQGGGLNQVATTSVNEFVQAIYTAWLGNGVSEPSVFAFVTSFSCARPQRVANHGVLSQWRGYCPNGGYAIVFDTQVLESLLREEGRIWEYELFGADIIYSHQRRRFLNEQNDKIAILTSGFKEWITEKKRSKKLSKTFRPLIYCACRYKHWGFSEEREVRLICAIPNRNLLTTTEVDRYKSALKPIHQKSKSDRMLPYITLLHGVTSLPAKPLPIKRIVVGPGLDSTSRHELAESLVREHQLNIPVTDSVIPYVPSHR